jgi:hypothetical protein
MTGSKVDMVSNPGVVLEVSCRSRGRGGRGIEFWIFRRVPTKLALSLFSTLARPDSTNTTMSRNEHRQLQYQQQSAEDIRAA